jgi:hypothetical protein
LDRRSARELDQPQYDGAGRRHGVHLRPDLGRGGTRAGVVEQELDRVTSTRIADLLVSTPVSIALRQRSR